MSDIADYWEEVWDCAEKHWPGVVNRQRTKAKLLDFKRLPATEDLPPAIPGEQRISYDLEAVGEFFEMAYDLSRDYLFVKDSRD